MSSSRMISTRKQGVFMAHICSECGFPQITVVQIEAEAQKEYIFSQSKAEQIAIETAENAICEEINRIESCYQTKLPLVGKRNGSSMIAPGHFCTSSFSGFASFCPKCLSIEPWKSTSSKKNMDDLVKDNFPVVFKDADKAEEWAFDKVRDIVAEISAKRENPAEIEKAIASVKEAKADILSLTHQMNSLPEQIEFDRLNEELKALRSKKANLGLLDFKAKKIIKEKIKILEPQVKSIKAVLDSKIEPLARQIITLGNNLLKTQAIAFGYTDDIMSKNSGNAFSYFFSPNDIPYEIMEEIENKSQILSNEESPKDINNESVVEEPQGNNDAIYCRKCGFKLLSNSTFCTKCGSKID